ncbi:MAG TPA: CoA-transferase [Anaerolineales bacterium]|jgi:glutaconate CoA-transferase subunit A|nr:CoA-transferase [Anaerolineales bacterium]
MTTKITDMRTAISAHVHDGDCVVIEGFTACICFAAAHEIIRQGRRELTLCRMTPDLVYEQMIAAGCARKLVFSYLGNPGVGSLHCVRRAVERGVPRALELEEYSHFGMVGRYMAGAARLPFFPVRSYSGTDQPKVNPRIKFVPNPYDGVASEFTHVDSVAVVPPLNPDVAILHAQRADAAGNTQMWGLLGTQKEVAFAAERVIVVVEEIVDSAVIRSDPNRTVFPGLLVDVLVQQPYGAHPSYAQGYYDRDNQFYLQWDAISRDEDATQAWLRDWVHGVDDWEAYLLKLESERPDIWERLAPGEALAQPVNYGAYAQA